jgi:hypothetical protein
LKSGLGSKKPDLKVVTGGGTKRQAAALISADFSMRLLACHIFVSGAPFCCREGLAGICAFRQGVTPGRRGSRQKYRKQPHAK